MSSFSSLSVALSALQAQRRAMDVAGQNVANAGTAGYTRQRAELDALGPAATYSLQGTPRRIGDGVEVTRIVRLSDEFATARLRGQEGEAAFLAAHKTTLNQIETRFNEPGDTGLTAQLAEMWASWSDVATHPDDEAARGVLLQQTQAVLDQIAAGYAGVSTQWDEMRAQTVALTDQVNATASAVAGLNESIRAAVAVGSPANELADERDQLILALSQLTGASTRSNEDGTVDVLLGGSALVRGDAAYALEVDGATTIEQARSPKVALRWVGNDNAPAVVPSGRIAANLSSLSTTLPTAADGYDDVASALADKVNTEHLKGYDLSKPTSVTGVAFFTGSKATDIAINPELLDDPRRIAASASADKRFDGSVADVIAGVATADGGPNQVWEKFVVDTGVLAQSASRRSATAEVVRKDAEAAWTSITSVDVDEEMVNLVGIQRAYEGAARVLTAVDQALDVLINRTGLVGR